MQLRYSRMDVVAFLRRNLVSEWNAKASWWRILKHWWHGFDSEHVVLYDLDDSNWRDYLPDLLAYRVTHGTNFHVWPILHDKLIFNSFMKGRLPIIEGLFWINEGRFNDSGKEYSWERFFAECRMGGKFVFKSAQGSKGYGLLFVEGSEDGAKVNGEWKDEEAFRLMIKGLNYHVCFPFVETHSVLKAVYPSAGNALRVTVFVGLDGKPRLLAPVLCVGTARSAPVEHFRHGGLLVQIDEATGRCVKAMRRGEDGRRERIEKHPDTGVALVGLEIPYWDEIRRSLLSFHDSNPSFDLVGWDVLVAEDGFKIIEGNHNPGLRIPLLNRNLASEPEFRALLEERGILRK
jgi:hypothetical protein